MMKKIIALFAAAVSACGVAFAASQQQDWKGRVLDENGEAFSYVNVILMSMPDSTVISGAITAEDGSFLIQSDARNAVLMVSMIGYRTVYVNTPDAGIVRLEPDTEVLGEALVTAVMPKTKLTDQGLLTSVRGSVLETVGTANDALARVPGLIKGQNGLEVLGKGAPLVYINGRKVTDSKELDRLQSNEIQSVEVITNPGAQYDATVRSVVRIRTIKHQGDGFGFNAGLSDDQSLRNSFNDPSGYLNMNFRHDGLDLFVGGNALKFTSTQASEISGESFGNPGFVQEGTLDFLQEMTNYGANGGLNWQISDAHSLGFRVDADMDPRIDVQQTLDENAYRGDEFIERLVSKGDHHIDDLPSSLKTNVYYNGTAGKLGIDFNADYYGVKMSQDAHTMEESSAGMDDDIRYLSHNDSHMYAAKLVLTYPVWQGALQMGSEDVLSRRSDDYTITSSKVPSSASEVKEDNYALFASYGFFLEKAGQFSAGLRFEHVDYSYEDLSGSDDLQRKYNNLFPTLSYANAFGPVQVQLSYSARTNRPAFEMLSSAVRYHSRYIFQSGNAKLQPQLDHDLGFNANWKFLTMVTQYSRIENTIAQWSELYNDEGVVLVRPINLDNPMRALAWYINASPTIGIWSMNYTAGVQQQWLTIESPSTSNAAVANTLSFSDKPMWIAQLFNTFSFKKGWRLELGGEYHSKAYVQNTLMTNNFFNLTAAVQKSLLDDALVIRLSGNDLTGTANYDVMENCGSHVIWQTNVMDTKRLTLSIRYNFNTAASKYKGTGAGRDTVQRMSN